MVHRYTCIMVQIMGFTWCTQILVDWYNIGQWGHKWIALVHRILFHRFVSLSDDTCQFYKIALCQSMYA